MDAGEVSTVADRPGAALARAGTIGRHWLRQPLLRVLFRRLLLSAPLLFCVSGLSFFLLSLAPGDASETILGLGAAPDQYVKLRHQLGLDRPVYEQYWHWLRHAVTGDLGTTAGTTIPVTKLIDQRVPVTLSLVACTLFLVVVVGTTLGIFSAVHRAVAGRFVDALALLGFALPGFWVGALLIELFAVKLGLFPAIGYVPFTQSPAQWARSLVLPVIALGLGGIAAVAKQTREAMLDILDSEHIRMARATGFSARSIHFKYALKNAAPRIVTLVGLIFLGMLGGTILAEYVFALPGLGGLVATAALQHDLPLVQGIVVYFTVVVVIVNLVIDLAYTWLDPRVRTS
jgi:peptide/nickel transport system permease protein